MKNCLKFGIILMFVIYEIIQAACLQLDGDDFWWQNIQNFSDVFGQCSPNGRYLTNAMTFFSVRYPVFRLGFHVLVMLLLFREIALVANQGKKPDHWKYWAFSAGLLLTVPNTLANSTIAWISGFPNYLFSEVLLLMYLRFCMPFLIGKGRDFRKVDIGLLILGFLSALCVEHITIYIVLLSMFMIIFCAVRFRKMYIGHVLYLLGAIAGTVLMFSDKNYHSVISGQEDLSGRRFVNFSFLDIIMKIYQEIIGYYAKPFYFLHLMIAVSLLILFLKKNPTSKYARFAMPIVLLFAGYSVFTQNIMDFQVLSAKYTVKALETAFVFLYLLSVIYLCYLFIDQKKFLLVCIFLISTLVLTAPFAVVNPVTARCFFAEYLFWGLTAGELILYCVQDHHSELLEKLSGICISSGLLVFSCILSIMRISNLYCDTLRMRYLREQLDQNSPSVIIIQLPYPELSGDPLASLNDEGGQYTYHLYGKEIQYANLIIDTYDLNPQLLDKKILLSDLYHYFLNSADQ